MSDQDYQSRDYPTTRSVNQSAPMSSDTEDITRDVAAREARSVRDDTRQAGSEVAAATKERAHDVVADARHEAGELYQQVRTELSSQADSQYRRATGGLRTLSDDLEVMSASSSQEGLAADVTRMASLRMRDAVDWLDRREPGEVVAELRGFARRHPGTFLITAAALGVIGGRITRGLIADRREAEYWRETDTNVGLGASSPARQQPQYTDATAYQRSEPSELT